MNNATLIVILDELGDLAALIAAVSLALECNTAFKKESERAGLALILDMAEQKSKQISDNLQQILP